MNSYESQDEPFLNRRLISPVMSLGRFAGLTVCLLGTNRVEIVRDKFEPNYDQVGKVRWLLHEMKARCVALFY